MGSKSKKIKFEVKDQETVSECLDRIAREGYTPVRRREEPVFKEVRKNGKLERIPVKQRIVFEAESK